MIFNLITLEKHTSKSQFQLLPGSQTNKSGPVCFISSVFFVSPQPAAADQTYGVQGYAIPSEDEYYQQEPNNNPEPDNSSMSSNKKGKPMPTESSFFIFSSQNR
jgi:hypothetical protein